MADDATTHLRHCGYAHDGIGEAISEQVFVTIMCRPVPASIYMQSGSRLCLRPGLASIHLWIRERGKENESHCIYSRLDDPRKTEDKEAFEQWRENHASHNIFKLLAFHHTRRCSHNPFGRPLGSGKLRRDRSYENWPSTARGGW